MARHATLTKHTRDDDDVCARTFVTESPFAEAALSYQTLQPSRSARWSCRIRHWSPPFAWQQPASARSERPLRWRRLQPCLSVCLISSSLGAVALPSPGACQGRMRARSRRLALADAALEATPSADRSSPGWRVFATPRHASIHHILLQALSSRTRALAPGSARWRCFATPRHASSRLDSHSPPPSP